MLMITLPFPNKSAAPHPPASPSQMRKRLPSPEVLMKELEGLRKELNSATLQLDIFKVIIERYGKFIEDGEAKSVAELRGLVRPMDHTITEMKINIQDAFHPYVYEKHFILAVQKSLDMLFSFRQVSLPINFWLQFEEIQRLDAADDIDLAIMLCSLLRALGSESARVLITKNKEALVSFSFSGKSYIVEISRKSMSAFPEGDDQYAQIVHTVMYSFNDREYEDFSEG